MPGSSLTYSIADPVAPLYFLNLPLSAINTSTDIIDLGTAHNLVTGNCIWFLFATTGATLVNSGGLSALRKYFVIAVTNNTIKLASTFSDANNGIAIDITSFDTNVTGFYFGKTSNLPNGPLGMLGFFPAYAKSNIIFNSSIPVEINFSIPAYTALSGTTFIVPIVALLRQEGAANCWGLAIRIQNVAFLYNGGVNEFYQMAVPASHVGGVGTALTAGYNQKYVITPSGAIEYWYGAIGSAMSLFFTSTALAANTQLRLEFGSNFTFCKVQDCTIKYL